MHRIVLQLACLLLVTLLISSCGTARVFKAYEGNPLARAELSLVAVKDSCNDIDNKPCVHSSCNSEAEFYFTKIFNEKAEKSTVLWQPKGGLSNDKYQYLVIKPGPYAIGLQFCDHSTLVDKDRVKNITKSKYVNTYGAAYLNLYAEPNSVYQLECFEGNRVAFKKIPVEYSNLKWVDGSYDKPVVRD